MKMNLTPEQQHLLGHVLANSAGGGPALLTPAVLAALAAARAGTNTDGDQSNQSAANPQAESSAGQQADAAANSTTDAPTNPTEPAISELQAQLAAATAQVQASTASIASLTAAQSESAKQVETLRAELSAANSLIASAAGVFSNLNNSMRVALNMAQCGTTDLSSEMRAYSELIGNVEKSFPRGGVVQHASSGAAGDGLETDLSKEADRLLASARLMEGK